MTSRFETQDPDFERRVRDSFVRQRVMETLGARLTHVGPGVADIELPFRLDLTQQHGFVHAGILATIADSACGYAAYTLMPPDAAVVSVEFKVNLLSPAKGGVGDGARPRSQIRTHHQRVRRRRLRPDRR